MSDRRREILCVDDDAQSLEVRKILLETFGFRVTTATNGPAGLRALQSRKMDCVVLDYHMPEMNGGEVARAVKQFRPDVPVVILSALAWLPEEAPKECIDAFIPKGEPTGLLVHKLQSLIANKAPTGKFVRIGFLRMAGAALGVAIEKLFARRQPARPKVAHVH